ncbi:MAG: T9SS type A sorting domain-containing protein, partial [Flavisolibacter sp.]
KIYPNPSNGRFNLVYQLGNNEILSADVVDAKGSIVKHYRNTGNGFVQKLNIDIMMLPSGVYLLKVDAGGEKKTFKLNKM